MSCSSRSSYRIFGKTLPVPGQPFDHHDFGNIFHTLDDPDEHVTILGLARCEAHTAIPHDHRGDAMV
jgi:hypothetical protein